jgi:hypothetical protein
MGLYDTFISPNGDVAIQIKLTHSEGLPRYREGDELPDFGLDGDLLVLGNEGFVVIREGRVMMIADTIYDKWGNLHESGDIIRTNNPIARVVSGEELDQVLHAKNEAFRNDEKTD